MQPAIKWNIAYSGAEKKTLLASKNQCLIKKQSHYDKINHIRFFFCEDDIDQLIEFHFKRQPKELTHFPLTISTIFLSCKEKERFIEYLIKEKQSNNESVNYLAGKFSCQNVSKQKLKYPDIFTIKAQYLNVFSQLTRRRI